MLAIKVCVKDKWSEQSNRNRKSVNRNRDGKHRRCRKERQGERITDTPWSSLVEGDEQLDRPNSQTTEEFSHTCVT